MSTPYDDHLHAMGKMDFHKFLRTYFPDRVCDPFTPAQLSAIDLIERTVLGQKRPAEILPRMQRQSGQTTLLMLAGLWSLAYAHDVGVQIVTRDERDAELLKESILFELECFNETARKILFGTFRPQTTTMGITFGPTLLLAIIPACSLTAEEGPPDGSGPGFTLTLHDEHAEDET